MTESMAEEWEKWLEQEKHNIETVEDRLDELSFLITTTSNFQYKDFWNKAQEIPSIIESLNPLPPAEKERLLEAHDNICNQMKKKQQREWESRKDRSTQDRQRLEQKIDQAWALTTSAPDDIKTLSKAQGLLKEALTLLKSEGENPAPENGNDQPATVLLRDDRQICWEKWHRTNDLVHQYRLAIWDRGFEQMEPLAKSALEEANEGNPQQALEKVKKAQQHLKSLSLNKTQREQIRDTLNTAWDTAIYKVNEIRDEKRRKYEEWISRIEGQFKELTSQFQQNEETISRLQAEVEQFKEAIQSIKSREYGDKLREEIAKKREKIKELGVVNRQLEGKIENVKSRLEEQSNGLPSPRSPRSEKPFAEEKTAPKQDEQRETSEQKTFAQEVEKMKIQWLGHASFLITGDEGTRIITDPYGAYDGLNYEPIGESADVVLISHQHGDHCGGKVGGNPEVVDKPQKVTVKGIEFKGIASHHDQSGGTERGDNIIFCFTLDGIKICHLGDLGHLLSDEQVEEIGKVDIIMIPVGGFFTINASEATRVCEQINPRVIIPMHVSNDKCAFPIARVDDFLQSKSNVERAGSSEKQFTKDDLPQEPKVVVLEHAK
ncbi:MAG: MBL fold metallo-hydrolase [Dehalococcoidia bacterium]